MVLSTFLLFLSLAPIDPLTEPESRTEVIIEKQVGDKGVAMSPQHVYSNGDMIRIRFRTNSDGFLYVVNRDTQNKLTVLFPREETGKDNRVHASVNYLIPSNTDGWFRIQGEPGYDTTYFVVSPKELNAPAKSERAESTSVAANAPAPAPVPNTMKPRCDDTLFRARGECLDSDSGARTVSPAEKLPSGVPTDSKIVSRDLTFVREARSTVILAKAPTDGYLVYEFRIAHR
jgi:Domain of unknown function (DUF4384)